MTNKILYADHYTANRCNEATSHTGRKSEDFVQLCIWHPIQSPEQKPFLQIESVPLQDRVNPKENRYALWIYPQGIRACGGQFTAEEAHEISKSTRGWDCSNSQVALERLADGICKRSSVKKAGGGQ
jgi:hypothetical protein